MTKNNEAKAFDKNSFQNPKIAKTWADISYKYGDEFRRAIVNPILHGIIKDSLSMQQERKPPYTDRDSPLVEALANYYSEFSPDGKALKEGEVLQFLVGKSEHDKWIEQTGSKFLNQQKSLHVLDYGCGEGYRGRWLAKGGINYTGIDYSQPLLERAENNLRSEVPDSHRNFLNYNYFDLSTAASNFHDLETYFTDNTQLVLAITTFEHMSRESILELLLKTRNKVADNKPAYLFVVTCNSRYYKKLENCGADCQVIGQLESMYDNAPGVKFYCRSRSFYSALFRDAGLVVLDQCTPLSPIEVRPDLDDSFDKATGPFHLWLLQLHGRKFGKKKITEVLSQLEGCDFATDLITKYSEVCDKDEIEIMTVTHGKEPIIGSNNSGGALYIMLSGEAYLQAHSEKVKKLPYGKGAILGDMELSSSVDDSVRATLYRKTVYTSGEEACVLCVIPMGDALKTVQATPSIEGRLHQLLRSRLQSQIWLMDAKTSSFGLRSAQNPANPNLKTQIEKSTGAPLLCLKKFTLSGSEVNDRHLEACHFLSACLVAAIENQRSTIKLTGLARHTLFIPEINKKVEAVGDVKKYVSQATRILVSAGIIYSAPMASTNSVYNLIKEAGSDSPLFKLQTTNPLGKYFSQFTKPPGGTKSSVFYLVEDEWALRRIASTPGHSTTRLLDQLLFLNSTYCVVESAGTSIPTLEEFGGRSDYLESSAPHVVQRNHRYQKAALDYMGQTLELNHAFDSLGFGLVLSTK